MQSNEAEKMGIVKVSNVASRYATIRKVLLSEYLESHDDPWIIAFSGGKDSTLLLQMVWETVSSVKAQERRRKIFVISNDTLVESPLVIEHLRKSIGTIRKASEEMGLPISAQITQPYVDQTFWVNVIGRGYIPPTRNFRWCTDRMKIQPTDKLLKGLVARHKRAILLVGTRRAESQNRSRNMKKHGVTANAMNPHSSVEGCRIFAPLADLLDNDVWMILMQRKPPWGGTHRELITLYRNAGGGECPLILTKDDAPSCGTSSPRFGCWTCTVVTKDRSMRGVIDSGHADQEMLESLFSFREELIELREDNCNRIPRRRDGHTKIRSDGTLVYGPFKLEVRRRILDNLLALQSQIKRSLISPSEIDFIQDIWRRDRIHEEGHIRLMAKLESETM